MKASKKRFIAIVLIICMLMSSGCGVALTPGAIGIETCISNFESSCRSIDLNGILDCINPDVAGPVRFILKIFMWFTKSDAEDVIKDIMENVFNNQYDIYDVFDDITLENPDIKIRGKEATAEYNLVYVVGSKGLRDKVEELQSQLGDMKSTEDIQSIQNILKSVDTIEGYQYYDGLEGINEFKNIEGLEDTDLGALLTQLKNLEKIEIPVTFLMKSVDGNWYIAGINLGTAESLNKTN